jgi:hypothetical protein
MMSLFDQEQVMDIYIQDLTRQLTEEVTQQVTQQVTKKKHF